MTVETGVQTTAAAVDGPLVCVECSHPEAVEGVLSHAPEDSPNVAAAKRRRVDAKMDAKSQYELAVDQEANKVALAGDSSGKRSDAISWDDYFMAVAKLSGMRSKDPSTQVGACVVDEDNRIVGIGYNGFPRGCSDDKLPWNRAAADELDTKYPYVCHAEMNAIMNKNVASLKGCTMYVALFPCNECAKLIIQSGIRRVVFLSDKYHAMPFMSASRRLLDMAGVEQKHYVPTKKEVVVSFA